MMILRQSARRESKVVAGLHGRGQLMSKNRQGIPGRCIWNEFKENGSVQTSRAGNNEDARHNPPSIV